MPWRARRCQPDDGYTTTFPTYFYSNTPSDPIDQSAQPGSFHDGGRVVYKKHGSRVVVLAQVKGHFVGSDRVEGTQTIRLRARDKYGRHRCTAKMRFTATR